MRFLIILSKIKFKLPYQNINSTKVIQIPKKTNKRVYNPTNTCDISGNKLVPGKTYMENGLKGWTGKWLAGRRTGYLNNNSTDALGDICEAITCKVRGVKNLNIENDNYRSPIDHSFDYELGVVKELYLI